MTIDSRRERAIEMRQGGATYKQICDELGVSMGKLCRWVKEAGLVGRQRTSREDRERAVELRRQGLSYAQIERETGVSKSTLSYRLKDIPLTEEHAAIINERQRTGRQRAAAAFASESHGSAGRGARRGAVTDRYLDGP